MTIDSEIPLSELRSTQKTLRVVCQEPSLAKYRLPVFRELAGRPGIELFLAYGNRAGLTNVPPDGFRGQEFNLWRRKMGPFPIYWHQPQWTYASRKRADVLVLNWNIQYLSFMPALIRARWQGVGTVVWGHGYSKQETWWRLRARSGMGRWADAALFYNHLTCDDYQQQLKWPKERCFVALNSIDQQPIEAARKTWLESPHDLEQFRQKHGLDAQQTLLFVSRLHADNGTQRLLTAAAELTSEFPRLRLVIIGKGEPEFSELKKLAEKLGIAERLIMPGAIYEESEIAPWFLSATVFVYPQNIGLSLLHAFGYGLPVVTSDKVASQNPEIEAFSDNYNGAFYRDGDNHDLSQVLRRLLCDQQLRQRLSQGAVETVSNRFTIPKMVDGLERAIRFAAARVGRQ